jgi:hypothetical protein
MIVNFGALGYDAPRCAGVMQLPEKDIAAQMANPQSEFQQLYTMGQYRAEYVIDIKLFELAQAGDIKAVEKLEMRKRVRKQGK